jgi:hypothetical protein
MTRKGLALSDQQLAVVQAAASLLPIEIRSWFLRRVADALSNIQHPADHQVARAITEVLDSVRMPIPLDLFDQCEGQR